MKKLVALLITVVMVASVFVMPSSAATLTQDKSLTVKNPISSMTVKAAGSDILVDKYSTTASTSYSKLLKVGLNFSYNQNTRSSSQDNYCGRIFPITLDSAGTLVFDTYAPTFKKDVSMDLYYDAECETELLGCYISGPSTTGTKTHDTAVIPNAGTYYLKVESYNYDDVFTNTIEMTLTFFTSKNITLKENITHYLGVSSSEKLYRIDVPSTKNVTVTSSDTFNFDLCDSKKNAIYNYQSISKYADKKCSYRLSKGTYYIRISSNYSDDDYFTLKYTTAADATLKNKSYKTYYPGDYKSTNYFKIKPTKSGYISVYMRKADNYDNSADITLCNSSKKAISEQMSVYSGSTYGRKAVFGVKKGQTYYLKVTSVGGKAAIKYTQTSVSEKSGSSRKKAKTLKSGKTVKGTITAADRRADYYKIKLTKKKTLKIYTKGSASGYLYMQMYTAKGKKSGYQETAVYGIDDSNTFESFFKLAKGTYYIKIYRKNSKSNGYYTLKWK